MRRSPRPGYGAAVDELQPLRITTARFGADSFVVALAGELDIGTSARFEEELDSLLDGGARRLVVDLLGVTFLGSVGLELLTRAAKQTRALGGECVVVSDDPRILRVFEITGLDRVFRIERSLMEAVAQLVGATAAVA
jgi:anti-sigma B factor antagonist